MYSDLAISTLTRGGYTVQIVNPDRGSYNPIVAAFSTRSELLSWLELNLISRSPDLVGDKPAEDGKT